MDYSLLEIELKKRLKFDYFWGRKQFDKFDNATNFIYSINNFEELVKEIDANFKEKPNYLELKNYTLNRWFNFWSSKAVEHIFCEDTKVKPHSNTKDKFTDFFIENIPFDLKSTVFPKGFKKSIPYAIEHKGELIKWLYANQSKQKRQHHKNRLFIVLIQTENDQEHWKLKAEILWLREVVSTYLRNFDSLKLHSFSFENKIINADIIWAIK